MENVVYQQSFYRTTLRFEIILFALGVHILKPKHYMSIKPIYIFRYHVLNITVQCQISM